MRDEMNERDIEMSLAIIHVLLNSFWCRDNFISVGKQEWHQVNCESTLSFFPSSFPLSLTHYYFFHISLSFYQNISHLSSIYLWLLLHFLRISLCDSNVLTSRMYLRSIVDLLCDPSSLHSAPKDPPNSCRSHSRLS